MAFEYLIEGRDGGSTTVRFVHSGLIAVTTGSPSTTR